MLDQEEIMEALAPLYRKQYDKYYSISQLAKEAVHNHQMKVYRVLTRWAEDLSLRMDGMKDAAEAFGISEDAFINAVNSDLIDITQVSTSSSAPQPEK